MSTAVTTVVVLIFGEVSPKSIAKESPEAFALFSAPILRVFLVLLTPFNFLFGQWKKLLSHLFHAQEDRSITEEELLTIVDEVEQAGGIDQQEGTLIRSAIEFSELEARDVLTPRVDITAVSLDTPKEEIAKILHKPVSPHSGLSGHYRPHSGHSLSKRFPQPCLPHRSGDILHHPPRPIYCRGEADR